ncbi:MAG: TIGR03751 family conjugal transfer lipoprotein [Candidatus Sedimenticola endophacoides]
MNISTDLMRLLFVFVALSLVSACSSTKEKIIPQDGPDMLDIYAQHQKAAARSSIDQARIDAATRSVDEEAGLEAYTREAATEIEQRFPLLPNPMMVLYVFPHLSGEGAPVPGYSTAFRLYAADQFALPGETGAP